jgi:hypothetical protein
MMRRIFMMVMLFSGFGSALTKIDSTRSRRRL